MDVPDPLHQIKQALNQIPSMPLEVIVAREQSAINILQFTKLKKLKAEFNPYEDKFIVTLQK